MTNVELRRALQLALDDEPDRRGQLIALALVTGGQTIALTLNTN